MEINEFSDLSDFILGEVDKIGEFVDGVGPSKKLIKCMNNQIMKYTKLYSKVLFKTEKQRIKIQEAIKTMPHSPIWKLFNYSLWKKIQEELKFQEIIYSDDIKEESEQEEVNQQVYYPVLVKENSVPDVCKEDEEENE